MIEEVRDFIKEGKLIDWKDKILVAVSGGVDSMVLVYLLKNLGFDLAVAHMNFQLRGKASDLDERFVLKWCKSMGLRCHTTKVDVKSVVNERGVSVQMAARKLRYEWFDKLVQAYGYQKIATAHHLNDSFETVLLNWIKGTGVKGLAGIPLTNEKVIRPLLDTTKEEILTFAKAHDLKWREDASNAASKYQRNLIRNEVVPLLEKINPSLLRTFKSSTKRMVGTHELVRQKVEEIRYDQLGTKTEARLDMKWFAGSAAHLVILSELLRPYGVHYLLACQIGKRHLSGKKFFTSSHKIWCDRNQLILTKNEHCKIDFLEIAKPEGTFVWGNWQFIVKEVNIEDVAFRDDGVAYFNAAKVSFPIRVRCWEQGDRFVPLGMKGTKKVSDFMIDNKIPLTLKHSIPIFESRGKIIWVGGYRIDDGCKVGADAEKAIRLEMEKMI